jgi:predicted DNA-binding protein
MEGGEGPVDDELHHTNLSLTVSQYERLRVLSFNTRRSISALIREAIDEYLDARESKSTGRADQ